MNRLYPSRVQPSHLPITLLKRSAKLQDQLEPQRENSPFCTVGVAPILGFSLLYGPMDSLSAVRL